MPVLRAFYNKGNVRTDVTEAQLLQAWKEFFDWNGNWKDLDKDHTYTYEKYKEVSDKEHLKKIISMPVHYLMESGKSFFVKKDGFAISIRSEMKDLVGSTAFKEHMKDIIEYRVMDYYKRRYREKVN